VKLAVLASGTGSNLQALIDRVHGHDGTLIVAVASDKPEALALQRAADAGIATRVFPASEFAGGRRERDAAMAQWLASLEVDLVVLAGYMQLVSPEFLSRFPDRVINVHPALLPAFPGLDAVGQALDYGVKVFGVTVHLVDSGVDSGAILMQQAVHIPDRTSAAPRSGAALCHTPRAPRRRTRPAHAHRLATGRPRRRPQSDPGVRCPNRRKAAHLQRIWRAQVA
jgi:phosphoribosylglycinamide formyltransferase-1